MVYILIVGNVLIYIDYWMWMIMRGG